MYRFFVKQEQIDMKEKKIHITGSDVNHIKNVLRMRQGETILSVQVTIWNTPVW